MSILEVLQNAQSNVGNMRVMGFALLNLVEHQLGNAIGLLEKGYPLDTNVEETLKDLDVQDVKPYEPLPHGQVFN